MICFELYSLILIHFFEEIFEVHLYFDIHICQNYNLRICKHSRVTRWQEWITLLNSGVFKKCESNFGYICPKTQKSFLKCQNEIS